MNSTAFRNAAFSLAVCCCAMGILGCNTASDNQQDAAPAADNVARTQLERGPLRVAVEVQPHPARLSDEPTLTLTLDYEVGVHVEKPPFGEAMGDFQIRRFSEPLPEVQADREIVRQIYTLEPMRTGKLQIDPIPVTFTDNRPKQDGKKRTVETEALEIEVTSLIEDQAPSLDDLKPPAGPVELPKARVSLPWLALIGLLLIVGLGIGVWLRFRKKAVTLELQLTPQELAYLELQQIVEQELSERDVKLFYVELTAVVRRFIERTTGIHAPEQTTEEFLQEIQAATVFSGSERDRLSLFLESADLVKFAAHQPTAGDIENTFERAKVFIGLARQETES